MKGRQAEMTEGLAEALADTQTELVAVKTGMDEIDCHIQELLLRVKRRQAEMTE